MTFTRYPTNRLSLLPGVSFGLPAFKSQQVPVQLDDRAAGRKLKDPDWRRYGAAAWAKRESERRKVG